MAAAREPSLPRLGACHTVWLTCGDQVALGERHLAILEAVRDAGSLNAAAKRLHVSYRDAWGKIREAEAVLGVDLIAARVGGSHGGGSRLTAIAQELVARLRAFRESQRQATARAVASYFGDSPWGAEGAGDDHLRLATTTSAADSGLLSALLPPFTQRTGIAVGVLAVGSGGALGLARAGRADAVLTHAPGAEEGAVGAGDLLNRRHVMTNDFVVVGPADDPAHVRTARGIAEALRRIATARALFLSRGDGSGTHQRERDLLAAARITRGHWYRRERAGMANLLRRAHAARAYVLTDRGTFAALADTLSLTILHSGDAALANPYSVLAVSPYRHPGANYLAAMALIAWLTAPDAQELIAAYRVGGRPVARPAASGR